MVSMLDHQHTIYCQMSHFSSVLNLCVVVCAYYDELYVYMHYLLHAAVQREFLHWQADRSFSGRALVHPSRYRAAGGREVDRS